MGRRYIPRVQAGRRRWQMKALLASLAGAARVVSCYRVSELATAPLECEQDKSGDFLLTLVLERGSRLLVSSCTTPGQVGSAGVLVLMGKGASYQQSQASPCPLPTTQGAGRIPGGGPQGVVR